MTIAHVVVDGDATLVRRLGPALQESLGHCRRLCAVHLHYVGRRGEIVVAVEGTKGRIPLILEPGEQDPGLVTEACQRLLNQVSN